MTFKKINDDKLIITFHSVEMPEFSNLDSLVSNTDDIRNVFVKLLDEARDRVGFDADDYTINVDTKVTLNDDVVIEITKLPKKAKKNNLLNNSKNKNEVLNINKKIIKNDKGTKAKSAKKQIEKNVSSRDSKPSVNLNDSVLKAKPKKVFKKIDNNYLIYRFDSFDDFVDFCLLLKHSSIKVAIKKIASECILYYYNEKYYLSLKNVNENYKNIATFYTGVTEFSKYCLNSDVMHLIIIEHGKVFVKDNAIEIVMKTLK